MNVAFARPSWWQRLAPIFQGFDLPFVGIIVFMCLLGLVNMYSVGFDHGTRFIEHGRNMMLGAMILFVVAQVPPQRLMALAVPLYTVGVVLLVATALFGITKKGATRWLNIGIVIQPSELIKITSSSASLTWRTATTGPVLRPSSGIRRTPWVPRCLRAKAPTGTRLPWPVSVRTRRSAPGSATAMATTRSPWRARRIPRLRHRACSRAAIM